MKKLFELNLDFVLWYKNRCSWDDLIDRTDSEIDVYKPGFLWGIILLGLSIFNIVLLPLFLISCIINFIYFLLIPYYKKKEERREEKKRKLLRAVKNKIIDEWILNYEKLVKRNGDYLKLVITPTLYGSSSAAYSHDITDFEFPEDHNITNIKDLICYFLFDYNIIKKSEKKVYTYNIRQSYINCKWGARRSLYDLYSLCLYYFPETKFIDVIKVIISILPIINCSFCNGVKRYVFYPPKISNFKNLNDSLEYGKNITVDFKIFNISLNDLKNYITDYE